MSSEETGQASVSASSKGDSLLNYLRFLGPKLSACRKEKDYCDVSLKIGNSGEIFYCHRIILASNSEFFKALLKHDFGPPLEEGIKYLSEEYVDEKSFLKLLNAMYGEPLQITDDWIPLFRTSMFLQLTYFIDQCEKHILQNMNKIDLTEIIALPELKICKNLYGAVKKHICRNFTKYYWRLGAISLDTVKDLLSDPELFVTNEEELFDFGKKWIVHDIENRKQDLQLIACLLKPFSTLCEQSLKIVLEIGNFIQNECAVDYCLKALLKTADDPRKNEDEGLKLDISSSLFFIQPNDNSEVLFGEFKNDAWVFFSEFKVPMSTELLGYYDSAVLKNALYFVAERKEFGDGAGCSSMNVTFHMLGKKRHEWIELMPPRQMPENLISCNSLLYLYENSSDDYQFSSYEPMLNRWLKVPAVNYPRKYAGIATDNEIIYMIGGTPSKTISQVMPRNIVEMYDSRRGHWSRIILPPQQIIINNGSYARKVCFSNNTLFMFHADELIRIDCRSWRVLGTDDLGKNFGDEWCLSWNNDRQELWLVNVEESVNIEIFGPDGTRKPSLVNPNAWLCPI